jgi:hypothetical protein
MRVLVTWSGMRHGCSWPGHLAESTTSRRAYGSKVQPVIATLAPLFVSVAGSRAGKGTPLPFPLAQLTACSSEEVAQ